MGVSGHPSFQGGGAVRAQAVQEYRYLKAALGDSFYGAGQAWSKATACWPPHNSKFAGAGGHEGNSI